MISQKVEKRIKAVSGVMLGGALVLASAMPALADDRRGIIFGSTPPEQIEAAVEVTGWPEANILAGETVTLMIHVDSDLLGAPSLEGELVGLGFGGEMVSIAELDADGKAELSLRPLIIGSLEIIPFFAGDQEGNYTFVEDDSATITVDAAPVKTTFWFDAEDESGSVSAYGGGQLNANAMIEPFCADDTDEAANTECYATYGVPAGTFMIMRDGETITDMTVEGTTVESQFAQPGDDLSGGAKAEFLMPAIIMPDIMLGSPASFELTAAFDPSNWFVSDVSGPHTVNVETLEVEVDVIVGDDWNEGSADSVNSELVPLTAFLSPADMFGAHITGSVTFLANGQAISDPIEIDPELDYVEFEWAPIEGGEYLVSAEFTPDTLNHFSAVSAEQAVMVIIPPVPNPFPNDDEAPDEEHVDEAPVDEEPAEDNNAKDEPNEEAPVTDGSTTGTDKLADTGASEILLMGLAGGGLLLLGTMVLFMRRQVK